jgi:hypothetical protein
MMTWWGPFALGFVTGLFVGEVTLAFFLALVRQGSAIEVVESPPLAGEHETPAQTTSDKDVPAHRLT